MATYRKLPEPQAGSRMRSGCQAVQEAVEGLGDGLVGLRCRRGFLGGAAALDELLFDFRLDLRPFAAERGHHDRLDDEHDVVAAGVVGADLGTLGRVEAALEERAEDGRLDAAPVELGRDAAWPGFRASAAAGPGRRRTGRR